MTVIERGETIVTVVTVPLQGIDEGAEKDRQDGERVAGGTGEGEGGALVEIAKISKEYVIRAVILIENITIAARGEEEEAPEVLQTEGNGKGEVAILLTKGIAAKVSAEHVTLCNL